MMLASGRETTSAPNVADFFAISLAVTITAPLNNPLPTRLTQFMACEGAIGTQACRRPVYARIAMATSAPASPIIRYSGSSSHLVESSG